MKRQFLALSLVSVLAAPVFAQAPPPTKPPVSPKAEQNDACARTPLGQGSDVDEKQPQNKAAQDKNLSDKLARSNGVICPPSHVDPDMKQPPPQSGGNMPVIPPPGSPGGNEQIQPK